MRGRSVALVRAELRRQGIAPMKVRKKPKPLFSSGQKKGKVTSKDITLFARQLSTMMSSGVPLVQGFEIMAKGVETPAMRSLIVGLKADLEGGSSLSQSLRKHPRYFDDLFCSMVQAGEQAGILETLLNKVATYKEKTEAIKGKIRKALFYPVAIILVAIVITIILLVWVVPQFQELFSSFGADLPAPTKVVLAMSGFMQQWWWAVLLLGIGTGYGLVRAKRDSERFNEFFDRTILQLPLFGEIIRKATTARFARTLSTMFAAGVPLVEAMESVAGAAGNRVYGHGILRMREEVATGRTLQAAMQDSHLFPNMVEQMVAVGEESGSLDAMLGKVADFYEEEVDDAVAGLSSLMEPIIMAVLGVLIGGLVIAMYLPIFKMGQAV